MKHFSAFHCKWPLQWAWRRSVLPFSWLTQCKFYHKPRAFGHPRGTTEWSIAERSVGAVSVGTLLLECTFSLWRLLMANCELLLVSGTKSRKVELDRKCGKVVSEPIKHIISAHQYDWLQQHCKSKWFSLSHTPCVFPVSQLTEPTRGREFWEMYFSD